MSERERMGGRNGKIVKKEGMAEKERKTVLVRNKVCEREGERVGEREGERD